MKKYFLIAVALICIYFIKVFGVNNNLQNISEEQDYIFAYGLYSDSLFQIAAQQFESFIQKYPTSIKRQNATLFAGECYFFMEQYAQAEKYYADFISQYPSSKYLPNVIIKIGQSKLYQKKYNQAIESFKLLLEKDVENELAGEAAYWVGESYLRAEDYNNALKYYLLSYENYPKNNLADYSIYSIAWAYQKITQYNNAHDWYTTLIEKYPNSNLCQNARLRKAETLYLLNDYEKTIKALVDAKLYFNDTNDLANADYLIAESYYKLKDYERAKQLYEIFINTYPNHKLLSEVKFNLAWCYIHLKANEKALVNFKDLSNVEGDIGIASLYRCGVLENILGNKDKAIQAYLKVLEMYPNSNWVDDASYDLGVIYYEEDNYLKAIQYFQSITNNYKESNLYAASNRMIGECLVAQSNFNEALKWFAEAVNSTNASFEIVQHSRYQIAYCLYKIKKYKDASQKFSEFISDYANHPKVVDANYYKAECEYLLGNYDEAIKHYSVLEKETTMAKKEDALYGIGWSYFKQQKYVESSEAFERLIKQYQKGKYAFDARLRLADSYFLLKDYKKAINSYQTLIKLYSDSKLVDYAYYQLGQAYIKVNNNPEAINTFNNLIKQNPKSTYADDAQFAKGYINFQRKDYDEAILEFQKLINIFKDSELVPRAYYFIGDSYYNLSKYSNAVKSYKEVLRLYPNSKYVADAISGIQYALNAQGKSAEAINVIDDFINEHKNTQIAEDLLLKKGEILLDEKKYVQAINVFSSFADKYPKSINNSMARYYLAKCYSAQGNYDSALLVYEKTINTPNVTEKIMGASYIESAEILIAQKKQDQAIKLLSGINTKIKNPEIIAISIIMIGNAYLSMQNTEEAIKHYEIVINNYSNLHVVDEAKISLARLFFNNGKYEQSKLMAQSISNRTDEVGAEAQYLIGAILAQNKEWSNAVTALLRVKYVFPSYERWVGRAYLGLGESYENLKNVQQAINAYKSVLSLKTDDYVINEAKNRLKRMGQ